MKIQKGNNGRYIDRKKVLAHYTEQAMLAAIWRENNPDPAIDPNKPKKEDKE